MPREMEFTGSPRDWLRRARSNLVRAKADKPEEVLWEDLCFDAQQAAEKAVKAVLVHRSIEFPKTHEIAELLEFLDKAGIAVPDDLWRAATVLSPFAVAARYPGRSATENEYQQAVALAEKVVRWAESVIEGRK